MKRGICGLFGAGLLAAALAPPSLAGNHRIELNSDMWLNGENLPCDSRQLQKLARDVATKLDR